MHREPRGLAADDEVPVLVDDAEFARFRDKAAFRFRQVEAYRLARTGAKVRRGNRCSVHQRAALADGPLHGAARKLGKRLAKDAIQPLAVLVRGDGMLQPFHGRGPAGVVRVRSLSTNVTGR